MSKKKNGYDPFHVGNLEEKQSKPTREETIEAQVRVFLDKRMTGECLREIVEHIEDVLEDYYDVLSDLHEEPIEIGDPRVSVVDVFTEIVLNPATEEERAIRSSLPEGSSATPSNEEHSVTSDSPVDTLDRLQRRGLARLYAVLAELCTFRARECSAPKHQEALLGDAEEALKLADAIHRGLKGCCSPERRSQINVENARKRRAGYREAVTGLIEKAVEGTTKHLTSRAIMTGIFLRARKLASRFGKPEPSEDTLLKQVHRWRSDPR